MSKLLQVTGRVQSRASHVGAGRVGHAQGLGRPPMGLLLRLFDHSSLVVH